MLDPSSRQVCCLGDCRCAQQCWAMFVQNLTWLPTAPAAVLLHESSSLVDETKRRVGLLPMSLGTLGLHGGLLVRC